MAHETHEQFAFEAYKGIEIADALTANGDNKIWLGTGDASGHAAGVWLTAEDAKELSRILVRMVQAHEARVHADRSTYSYTAASANSPSQDPTAFPG